MGHGVPREGSEMNSNNELQNDRSLWPDVDHLPSMCEARDCNAPADPNAVAENAYACAEHFTNVDVSA